MIDSCVRNIYFTCRPMLVYRMTVVSLRLFHNNLGNFLEFFGQVVHSLPLPRQKNGPHTYDIIGLFDPSFSITDTETINKLRQDISDIQETTKRLISCLFVLWSSIVLILTLRRRDIFSSPNLFLCINGTNCRLVLLS